MNITFEDHFLFTDLRKHAEFIGRENIISIETLSERDDDYRPIRIWFWEEN